MNPINVNPKDPIAGFSAVARNFTGLGTVMKKGGYSTNFAGKWDCGMATKDHTPLGRGYDNSLIYFHHMNDYWMEWFVGTPKKDSNSDDFAEDSCTGTTYSLSNPPIDLWLGKNGREGPARGMNGTGTGTLDHAKVSGCSVGQNNTCSAPPNAAPANSPALEENCAPYPGWPGQQVSGCTYEDGPDPPPFASVCAL